MDKEKRARPAVSTERHPWTSPRLVRMGTVAALTSKNDISGRNDGGSGKMKRT